MCTSEVDVNGSWVPQSCTLPTTEQPLRAAEFDAFFTDAVKSAERAEPTRLVLELEPTAQTAERVAGLMGRETACCSFFTFTLTATGAALALEVAVPTGYVDVLDSLAHRADGSVAVGV